jgi:hypothetical protein
MAKDKKKLSYFRPNKKYKQLGLKYCKNKKENKNIVCISIVIVHSHLMLNWCLMKI